MEQGINNMIMSSVNDSEIDSLNKSLVNNEINNEMIMNTVNESTSEDIKQNQETLNAAVNNKRDITKLLRYMKPKTMKRENKKIGRNDPCPCGSGKKYKNCCLDSGKYEKLISN